MNSSIKCLRIFAGVGLLLAVIAFGYFTRSPWVILPLAFIFTVSFTLGHWQSWILLSSTDGIFSVLIDQWKTFIVQLIMCGIFYLIGRGLNTFFSNENQSIVFNQSDIWALLALTVFAILGGLLVLFLEKKVNVEAFLEQTPNDEASEDDGFRVDLTPVTIDTFFEGHHHANKNHVYDDTQETVLNPNRAFVSEAQITEVEDKLNIRLPKKLRALYLHQNGGTVGHLVTPLVENPSAHNYKDWIAPFSGYDDLYTLDQLDTVYESVMDYADPEGEPEEFPTGCKRMIVIAQWYRHTLFLDYRNTDESKMDKPRIGFVDFDEYEDLRDSYWESQAHWWDDFDSFFVQLRYSEFL